MTDQQMNIASKAMAHAGYCRDHLTVAFWSTHEAQSEQHMAMALQHFEFVAATLGYRIEKIEPATVEEETSIRPRIVGIAYDHARGA